MGDEPATEDLTRAVADRVLERLARADQERILLEAVVDNIPAGILVVDAEGKPVIANREALRLFGFEGTADLAQWREIEAYRLDGLPLEETDVPLARTLATGEVVQAEVYELVVGGRHVIHEISTAPVGAAGERNGGLAVIRDVTLRHQSERAERDFVTNAAHELQSPLAAIVSAIEVLQAGAKDRPERDMFLAHIERESERLARLVRALLILARTQVGVEAPRDEIVALCPLLQEVGAGLAVSGGVQLEIDCPKELGVLTNRELVEQAVVNLAENAAKHTESGRITLSAKELADGAVEIAVADTGSGIAAAERPRVFERFYRADADGVPGFGLGLAIVRAVAEALEGELELDSTSGAGTVIRLRIPKAATMLSS